MLDDLCDPAPTPTELTDIYLLHHILMLPFIKRTFEKNKNLQIIIENIAQLKAPIL